MLDTQSFYETRWQQIGQGLLGEQRMRAEKILLHLKTYVLPNISPGVRLKLLDLGCGSGWLTSLLTDFGDVYGADFFSESILATARQLHPDVQFTVIDDNHPSWGIDASPPFDVIICSEVIEHVPNAQKDAFIARVNDLLNNEGLLLLTTPNGRYFSEWHFVMSQRKYQFQPIEDWVTPLQLHQLLDKHKFRVIEQKTFYSHFSNRGVHGLLRIRGLGRLFQLVGVDWKAFRDKFGLYQILVAQKVSTISQSN